MLRGVRSQIQRAVPRLNQAVCKRMSTQQASRSDYCLTTLDNGVKVASDPNPGYFAAMGVYVDAGSRYEDPNLSGCSHIVDRLAFRSTTTRSATEMAETLEALGGNYASTSSRESIMYQASVFNSDIERMFDVLTETVCNPNITDEEVAAVRDAVSYENYEIWQKPELILPELIHTAAFSGGLGNPLLCPQERIPYITKELIQEYRRLMYRPERFVAAFVSVDHDTAVKLAEKYLGHLPKSSEPSPVTTSTSYVGNELVVPMPEPIGNLPQFTQLYIAFEGVSLNDPDVYALATLHTLLGGGGSFSAGGPGKGMYSRLYTHVLNQFGQVESAQAFNHAYPETGLFGIAASCIPQAAPYLAEIMCQQFYMAMSTGHGALTYDEVSRAKNQLKSSLLMNLESKMIELEDLGRQVLINGRKIPVQEMVEKIDALSVEDVRRVARRVFTGNASKNGSGKPTVLVQGPRESFGDVDAVLRRYGLGRSASQPAPEQKKGWLF
uniref:Alpha-MPP n=1 Tax=Blastobotrys adeninivorans TaxID=409370 RepID=A0A060T366_BLAAD